MRIWSRIYVRRWCCAVPRPVAQRSRSWLWTVLEFHRVGENCRASIFLRSQLYFLLFEFLGTREEEQFWSDKQEQEDIDGTGEAEH